MNNVLPLIEPVFGFFPVTALITAGILWGIFQLTIKMRCHPRLSQHFIFMGLCIITCISFIHPAYHPDIADLQEFTVEIPEEEYQGSTVSIDQEGITRLNDFRPDLHNYTSHSQETGTGSNLFETILVKTYALFNKGNIRHIYFAGIAAILLYLALQVIRLKNIQNRCYPDSSYNGITLYNSHYTMPFSFGKSIFLPIDQPEETRRYVLLHEESHIRHRHSYKLCLLLFLAAFNWYNPFVWLLLAENKITQEMEADSDVMLQGCIPTEYQMNLIRMAVRNKEWIWIRSSYNHHPLKKRILFMNDSINLKQSRIIIWLASLLFIAITSVILGCNSDAVRSFNEKDIFDDDAMHAGTGNALSGSWRLEGTSPDTTCTHIYHPKGECYKFYGKDIVLTFISYGNNHSGLNAYFNASGESYRILSDTTVLESSKTLAYKFKKQDEMLMTAYKPTEKDSHPDGKSEIWRRTTGIPDGLRRIFRSAVSGNGEMHKFKGTWKLINITEVNTQNTIDAAPHVYKMYGDDTYIAFYAVQLTPKNIDYSFEGHCGTFSYISDEKIAEKGSVVDIEWIDEDHYYLTYFDGVGLQKERWERASLPEELRRIVKDIAPVILP